jgi:cell division protein FtsB
LFIFLALLISLLLITNIDALLNYRQVQRRMENLQKEYDALKREIEIRESELELLRGLVPGSNDGGTR